MKRRSFLTNAAKTMLALVSPAPAMVGDSYANNHIFDWSEGGLIETLETLERVEVKAVGAGRDLDEASAPSILEIGRNGRVIVFAFESATSGIPHDWAASGNRPGVNFLEDLSDSVIHRPARIALDFPDTRVGFRPRTRRVGVGMVQRVTAVQARDRTRVVLQLTKLARHEVKVRGRFVYVTVGVLDGRVGRITNVEFRPIESGGGRVVVEQSPPASFVETRREAERIIVDFIGALLPAHLDRRLDVGDFGTPIKEIDTFPRGKDVRMIIITRGPSQHFAYQQATGRLALVVSP